MNASPQINDVYASAPAKLRLMCKVGVIGLRTQYAATNTVILIQTETIHTSKRIGTLIIYRKSSSDSIGQFSVELTSSIDDLLSVETRAAAVGRTTTVARSRRWIPWRRCHRGRRCCIAATNGDDVDIRNNCHLR